MTCQEIFGEGFRPFQLGSTFRWSEDFQASSAERVNYANHQRRFRADNGQIDFLILGKVQQGRDIGHTDGDVLQSGFQGSTGVTRCHEDRFHPRRLRRFPRQGVLASAVTNH